MMTCLCTWGLLKKNALGLALHFRSVHRRLEDSILGALSRLSSAEATDIKLPEKRMHQPRPRRCYLRRAGCPADHTQRWDGRCSLVWLCCAAKFDEGDAEVDGGNVNFRKNQLIVGASGSANKLA